MRFLFLLFLFEFSACVSHEELPGHQKGRVTSVADGDSFVVLSGSRSFKVRLFAIDCPEKGQPFARRARKETSKLTLGKLVTVVPVEEDRYGRTVAKVLLSDGTDIREKLVGRGFCHWYKRYGEKELRLKELEERAKTARLGLWSLPKVTPPWEYRLVNRR